MRFSIARRPAGASPDPAGAEPVSLGGGLAGLRRCRARDGVLKPRGRRATSAVMDPFRRQPKVLDMTPDGEFRDPAPSPPAGVDALLAKVGGVALLVAVAAVGLLFASLAVMALGLLLPIALAAGLIAFGTFWWRARRARARGEPVPAFRFVFLRR